MAKQQHTEQASWWPEALARFEQLAAAGIARTTACTTLAGEFPVSDSTLQNVCGRGSVKVYPPKELMRAAAWASGQERYEGKTCALHGTTTRFSNDGVCVECTKESYQLHKARVEKWRAIAEGGSNAAAE